MRNQRLNVCTQELFGLKQLRVFTSFKRCTYSKTLDLKDVQGGGSLAYLMMLTLYRREWVDGPHFAFLTI